MYAMRPSCPYSVPQNGGDNNRKLVGVPRGASGMPRVPATEYSAVTPSPTREARAYLTGARAVGAVRERGLRLVRATADREPREVTALERVARSEAARSETLIRVLIAAGPALVRASYRAMVERDERMEVVGEATSGPQALGLATATVPDVALLDLQLPGLDDVETTAAIVSHSAFDGVAVMLITVREGDERVVSALRAGAIGVLSNDAQPGDLIRALEVLAGGQALLPADALRRLRAELAAQSHHARLPIELDELTPREREVMTLVGLGLSNSEIAERLVISPATAKTHVSRAMVKLHARNRAQLVILAYETGLVLARTHAARAGDPERAIA
jgi:DNA-binding NarL/FixJ family response regulator